VHTDGGEARGTGETCRGVSVWVKWLANAVPALRGRSRTAVVAGCALALLAVPPAGWAMSVDDQREDVDRKISRTQQQLDQSSAELVSASRRLDRARTALGTAKTTLARTRGELAAAQALDARMQKRLAEATQELRAASSALAEGRARVQGQEEVLRRIAVAQYAGADPGLLALSMVMHSQDATELTGQLNSVGNVLEKEAVSLERLKASRVMLDVQEQTVRKARREVAQLRADAADNLARKAALEAEAEATEARISGLVQARSRARQEAATARTADLQELRQLEDERERIGELLRQRAAEARRRAAAEAAAKARARAAAVREAAKRAEQEAAARRAARQAARRGAPEPQPKSKVKKPAPRPHRVAPAPEPQPKPKVKKPAPRPHRVAPAPAPSGLLTPVNGYVTSPYGMRFHPVYKRWSLHDGLDYGASCGTPIRAAASGTVVATGYHSAYGNRVIMDHGLRRGVGLGSAYNHLSAYSTYTGQRVQRGDVIGFVGTTGASTGCHLHFMVFENGRTVDPVKWL
jgi:murein DD-endopeptidase MepM/ murein hydrolase activator NlpD